MAKKQKTIKDMIARVDEVPVTHLEMKAARKQISSLKISMDSGFESFENKFESIETSITKGFKSLEAMVRSQVSTLSTEIHCIKLTVEEQNSRNKVVMESQDYILQKLIEYDSRIGSLEDKVHGIR